MRKMGCGPPRKAFVIILGAMSFNMASLSDRSATIFFSLAFNRSLDGGLNGA